MLTATQERMRDIWVDDLGNPHGTITFCKNDPRKYLCGVCNDTVERLGDSKWILGQHHGSKTHATNLRKYKQETPSDEDDEEEQQEEEENSSSQGPPRKRERARSIDLSYRSSHARVQHQVATLPLPANRKKRERSPSPHPPPPRASFQDMTLEAYQRFLSSEAAETMFKQRLDHVLSTNVVDELIFEGVRAFMKY